MNEIDLINDYFSGALSPEEMKRFDLKIQQDPVFAEDVAFFCSARQEAKNQLHAEKKAQFRQLYATSSDQQKKTPVFFMRGWVRTAAAALIIIAALLSWLLWPQTSARELADQYIQQHFYQLPNTMGSNTTDSLQTAINLTNRNQLAEALAIFENFAAKDNKNESAIKNAGIVSLRMKNYDKALAYFSQLEQMAQLYSNPGKFYKAITLLQRNLPGDKQTAKTLLEEVIKSDPENKDIATSISKQL